MGQLLKQWICGVGLVLTLGGTGGAVQAQEQVTSETESAAPEGLWKASIFAKEEFRIRSQGESLGQTGLVSQPAESGTDNDFRFHLDAGLASPTEDFRLDFSGSLYLDLEGTPDPGSTDGLSTVYDFRNPMWDVWTLKADWKTHSALSLVRVGRQASEHGLITTFDGAALEGKFTPKLRWFAFGGRTAHFFEMKSAGFEDWVGSLGVTLLANKAYKFELDYRLNQEDLSPNLSLEKKGQLDHTVGVTAWLRPTEDLRSKLYLRTLNDTVSHLGANALWDFEGIAAGLRGHLDLQLVTLGEVHEGEDPFWVILGTSHPHYRLGLEAFKDFDLAFATLGWQLGWSLRQTLDGENSTFNRNIGKLYSNLALRDWGKKGTYLTFTVDTLYVPDGLGATSEMELALSGAVGYRKDGYLAEVGTSYQKYQIDYFQDLNERMNVRTVYAKAGMRIVDALSVSARYDYEVLDRNVHTLLLGLSQVF